LGLGRLVERKALVEIAKKGKRSTTVKSSSLMMARQGHKRRLGPLSRWRGGGRGGKKKEEFHSTCESLKEKKEARE